MFTYFALFPLWVICLLRSVLHCIHRTHLAYDGIHIDHGIEEQTQEQPLIEEPEDQEPDLQPEEYPQAAPDFASEEANPSEQGRQDHILPANNVL